MKNGTHEWKSLGDDIQCAAVEPFRKGCVARRVVATAVAIAVAVVGWEALSHMRLTCSRVLI